MILYLIANTRPLDTDRLPTPQVVASITLAPEFLGTLNADALLRGIAGKMGLFDFDIIHADAQGRPGEQLRIPFPTTRRKR